MNLERLDSALDERALASVAAAAEGTRLRILFFLGREGPRCVGDVAQRFKSSRPAISHHLRVLKSCELVEAERRGQEIFYSVRRDRLVQTLRDLADSFERCCGSGGAR